MDSSLEWEIYSLLTFFGGEKIDGLSVWFGINRSLLFCIQRTTLYFPCFACLSPFFKEETSCLSDRISSISASET